VTLRPIAPEDKPLLAAIFERLSEESRYRRFFTTKNELSPADLDYLVDVDHSDHGAIIAIDPLSGKALGVARYIRSKGHAEVAEVAVTVADDWQGRGLGRALLDRLTYRARREGVRRFSALVQGDNPGALVPRRHGRNAHAHAPGADVVAPDGGDVSPALPRPRQ
jgi:GNAT superfamily N-acetyltransferase